MNHIEHYLDQRYISWNPQQPNRTSLLSQRSSHTRPLFVQKDQTKLLNPALNQVIKTMQHAAQPTPSSCSLQQPDSHLCSD